MTLAALRYQPAPTWKQEQAADALDRRVFNRSDAADVDAAEREARIRSLEREAEAIARVVVPRKPPASAKVLEDVNGHVAKKESRKEVPRLRMHG